MAERPPWFDAAAAPSGSLHAPAALRNRDPILDVLRRHLPARGLVLEIASGSGEHATFFAEALPDLTWQPSDPDEAALRSIAAHRTRAGLANLRAPVRFDVTDTCWPVENCDAIVAINMLQVAPRGALGGLTTGARRLLSARGVLILYGPFLDGDATTPGNAAFDASLRLRNAGWGLYDWRAIVSAADRAGLALTERVAMPANNLSLVFSAQ